MSPQEEEQAAQRRALRKARSVAFALGEDWRRSQIPEGFAVATCFFNFAGYSRPAQNLRRFLRQMDAMGIAVYGLEAHFPKDRPMESTLMRPTWKTVKVSQKNLLWQKEAMLNKVVEDMPENIKYVAIVDADVFLDNLNWPQESVEMLESGYKAVQPFSKAIWTDERGAIDMVRDACPKLQGEHAKEYDLANRVHPGFAWVLHRDFWKSGPGLFCLAATGAGDVSLAHGLIQRPFDQHIRRSVSEQDIDTLKKWIDEAHEWRRGEGVCFIKGNCWHEWHGSRKNRNYDGRHDVLKKVHMGASIKVGKSGLLEWKSNAPSDVKKEIANYFVERKEDGE